MPKDIDPADLPDLPDLDDYPVYEEDETAAEGPLEEAPDPISPIAAVTRRVIEAHLAPLIARILDGEPACAVIQPPTPDWCAPLAKAVEAAIFQKAPFGKHSHGLTLVRDKPARSSTQDADALQVVERLAGGHAQIGVSHDLALLPAVMRRAADLIITLPRLPGEDLRAVIAAVTLEDPGPISDDLAGAMSLEDVATSVRPGSSASESLARLDAAREAYSRTRSVTVPRLEDLAGYAEAREWGLGLAREVSRYRAGEISLSDLPRGLLLSGPPGCGKTLFAQALARSCGLPIIATSAATWLSHGSGHLDDAIRGMRADFASATALTPAILFVDEVDSIVDPSHETSSKAWWMSFRAALLASIDGATSEPGVVLVGACNHPSLVDNALKRSGRLDRHIQIGLPDRDALAQILRGHLGADLQSVDLQSLAQFALGATGADIARFVREARAHARDAGRSIAAEDLMRVLMPPDTRSAEQSRVIAVHEAGHAVVALALGRRVERVSLRANAASEGHAAISLPERLSRAALEDEVLIALAGRAADVVVGAGPCAGASQDLERATSLLVAARQRYGLAGSLVSHGPCSDIAKLLASDPVLRAQIEDDTQRVWSRALALVRSNQRAVDRVASALTAERVLSAERMTELVSANIGPLGAK